MLASYETLQSDINMRYIRLRSYTPQANMIYSRHKGSSVLWNNIFCSQIHFVSN